jgi:hypothetical protein
METELPPERLREAVEQAQLRLLNRRPTKVYLLSVNSGQGFSDGLAAATMKGHRPVYETYRLTATQNGSITYFNILLEVYDD